MRYIYYLFLLTIILFSCKKQPENINNDIPQVDFNQALANELKQMAEIDQIAAYIPQGDYTNLSKEQWASFKDSVFTTHQNRLEEIFDTYGFTGFDLVGEEGSLNFWLMTQHSDHNPEFQQRVLSKMKTEVDRSNATPSNYGLLVDRVRLNTGQKQVYGTQTTYNTETGQAYPRPMEDSLKVNDRRASIGLDPIEEYLNEMTKSHFEMNKEYYSKKGIAAPTLYKQQA